MDVPSLNIWRPLSALSEKDAEERGPLSCTKDAACLLEPVSFSRFLAPLFSLGCTCLLEPLWQSQGPTRPRVGP